MIRTRPIGNLVLMVTAAFFAVLQALAGNACAAPEGQRIAVILSHQGEPFEGVLAGFREYLSSRGITAHFDISITETDQRKTLQALNAAQSGKADLIFTLGSNATEAAIRTRCAIPVIAGLILNSDEIGKADNLGCVVLDFPLKVHLDWISKILPKCRNVGVLYSPLKNQRKVEEAIEEARNRGISIYARSIERPSDLPDALEYLAKRVDVLWGIPDELVYAPQTAKEILLLSFKNDIPVIGLSSAWVKAGALYSLDWDFRDMGIQCGEMAEKILRQNNAPISKVVYPRRVKYSINLRTAEHMKLEIPEALIRGAGQIFR